MFLKYIEMFGFKSFVERTRIDFGPGITAVVGPNRCVNKSREFAREGPFSVKLRKANVKHQFADLDLIVDDRTLTQKHVNLYQPVMFSTPDSPQPVEVVINQIGKNHIHGYIAAPRYRQSELASAPAAATNGAQDPDGGTVQVASPTLQTRPRQ